MGGGARKGKEIKECAVCIMYKQEIQEAKMS